MMNIGNCFPRVDAKNYKNINVNKTAKGQQHLTTLVLLRVSLGDKNYF